MKQLILFVIVGLAFITLQVATVGAQEGRLGFRGASDVRLCSFVILLRSLPIKAIKK